MSTLQRPDTLLLFLFLAPVGYQPSAWRHPQSRVEDLYGLELPTMIAERAEAAKIHALFLADSLTFGETGRNPTLCGYEPITTMGALAAATERIGLVGTVSTTFNEPFNVARYFAQLDFLSKGRVGWNIVTSFTGQENFSAALPQSEERYDKAHEYMKVVTGLWEAWQDDAVLNDRKAGIWADTKKIEPVEYRSENYGAAGPLQLPRSPQGWPVLVQAGASQAGMDFAAAYGEVVFTARSELSQATTFYSDLRARAHDRGRGPGLPLILPGLMPYVGDTESEARELYNELSDYIDFDTGAGQLALWLNHPDLEGLSRDEPIPPERLDPPDVALAHGAVSRYRHFYELAVEQKLTLRELMREAGSAAGHSVVVGTPDTVADYMQGWFERRACDGFTLLPPGVPIGLDRILDRLIPALQDRGLFQTDYAAVTLRQSLGLNRPKGRS